MGEGKNCLMRNLSNENTAVLQLHFIVIFHFLFEVFVEIFNDGILDKYIHFGRTSCIITYWSKVGYLENHKQFV